MLLGGPALSRSVLDELLNPLAGVATHQRPTCGRSLERYDSGRSWRCWWQEPPPMIAIPCRP
eukprot:7226212-Pyramimonas_sp.AAC.1